MGKKTDKYWQKRADKRMENAHHRTDKYLSILVSAYQTCVDNIVKDVNRLILKYARSMQITIDAARKLLESPMSDDDIDIFMEQLKNCKDESLKKDLEEQLLTKGTGRNIAGKEKLKKSIEKTCENLGVQDIAQKALEQPLSKEDTKELQKQVSECQNEQVKERLEEQIKEPEKPITAKEAVQASIETNCANLGTKEIEVSTAAYEEVYKEEILQNHYDTQVGTGIAYEFDRVPEKQVEEVLNNDWSGRHYSERIWGNQETFAKLLEETILKGIMSGTNSRKLARELDKITSAGQYACERLIRTETTYFVTMADLKAAEQRGIEKIRFLATLDNRTSPQCQAADGKVIAVKDAVPGKNIPPLHPFCRSCIVDVIEGWEHKTRSATDPVTGEPMKVPADMTYPEWKKQYIDSGVLRSDKTIVGRITERVKGRISKKQKELNQYLKDVENGIKNSKSPVRRLLMREFSITHFSSIINSRNPKPRYNKKKDVVYLDPNEDITTAAHEILHRIDNKYGISQNNDIISIFEDDYSKWSCDPKDRIDYLQKKYPQMFVTKTNRVKIEYRGISDIISALSNDTINLGYHHNSQYWTPLTKSKEILAQYGRIYYDNNKEVVKIFEELFPNGDFNIGEIIRRI